MRDGENDDGKTYRENPRDRERDSERPRVMYSRNRELYSFTTRHLPSSFRSRLSKRDARCSSCLRDRIGTSRKKKSTESAPEGTKERNKREVLPAPKEARKMIVDLHSPSLTLQGDRAERKMPGCVLKVSGGRRNERCGGGNRQEKKKSHRLRHSE